MVITIGAMIGAGKSSLAKLVGEHKNGITAGKDLSEEINKSPHGKDVLKDLPVVGKLK